MAKKRKVLETSPNDMITERLKSLRSNLPPPRQNLSEKDKDMLILAAGGPRTVTSIEKAKNDYPIERIPWLFSSLDSQVVVDILHNDMESAVKRALAVKKK